MARNKPKQDFGCQFIQSDVRDYKFKRHEFTHIIHGAEAGPEATENVLRSESNVFLLSSGAAQYPGTPYADLKIESERLVSEYGGVICRLFTFMGPHLPLDGTFAAGNFIRDSLLTGTIHIKGDGTAVRSYMHTEDMSKHVWDLLYSGVPSQVYDVGSDLPVNMLWLAEEIARQAGEKTGRIIEVEVDCGQTSALAPNHYVPSTGVHCSIGIKEAISKTLDWAIESLL